MLAGTLAVLPVAGCGGGGGEVPFSALEPNAVAADCRIKVLCSDFPDQASCVSSQQAQPHYYDTIAADIASGKVLYDGAKARSCIDALNAVSSCPGGFTNVVLEMAVPCTGIFTGTVAAGGACYFPEECAGGVGCGFTSGASCDSVTQCCAGTCAATPVVVPAGGSCSSGGACAPGTVCDNSGTCVATRATVGASCAGINSCAAPLYCSQMTQTCQQLPQTGETCAPGSPIPSPGEIRCQNPLDTCDVASNVCVPTIGLGGACDPSTGGCVSYAFCDPTTDVCVEEPAVGQRCDPNGAPCLGGSCEATTGTCALLATSGACS